jgi:PEP-CTERM motif-containing protein
MSTPARLVPLGTALWLLLSPVAAAATSALFDFDDFSYSGPSSGPEFDAPYTYDYRCGGKAYCTGREVIDLSNDGGVDPALSAVRNGIVMEIGRYGLDMTVNYSGGGAVDVGNSPEDFTLFLLDFDTPLRSFASDIERPRIIDPEYCEVPPGGDCPPSPTRVVYDLIQVYLWSDPGGTGDLVGHLTITPYDPLDVTNFIGHISMASDQPFRSVNFGKAISEDPDCILGTTIPCGYASPTRGHFYNSYAIDNILVSTIPEPSTLLLVGLGLVGVGAGSRANWIRIR